MMPFAPKERRPTLLLSRSLFCQTTPDTERVGEPRTAGSRRESLSIHLSDCQAYHSMQKKAVTSIERTHHTDQFNKSRCCVEIDRRVLRCNTAEHGGHRRIRARQRHNESRCVGSTSRVHGRRWEDSKEVPSGVVLLKHHPERPVTVPLDL